LATSEVEVANSALILLGAGRINALTEDSKEARIMKEELPKMRDEVMRSHPWNFAIDTIQLAEISTVPETSFSKQYQIPSKVLRVLRVHDGTVEDTHYHLNTVANFPWQRKKDRIHTDLGPAFADVIERVTAVASWDANFVEVVAMRLAAQTAYAITQSNTVTKQMFESYGIFLRLARSYDGQEGSTQQITASEFFNVRF